MKLSIVIPVYNSEEYLRDCLNSVFDQCLPPDEYEVICVNDGSTDSSLEILRRYSEKHSNLKIISQKNAGQGAARNAGADAARGKYLWFVDSDDFVDTDCFKDIVGIMETKSVDFLTIGLRYIPEESVYKKTGTGKRKKLRIRSKSSSKICCSGPRIMARDIIVKNHIKWNSALTCDDFVYLFYVGLYCRHAAYCGSIKYYCRNRKNSVSRQRNPAYFQKEYQSNRKLIDIYRGELQKAWNRKIKRQIERKVRLSVQALLLKAALSGDKEKQDETVLYLKSIGYYPYSFLFFNLKFTASWKNTVVNFSMFLFPFRSYYRFYCWILRKTGLCLNYQVDG